MTHTRPVRYGLVGFKRSPYIMRVFKMCHVRSLSPCEYPVPSEYQQCAWWGGDSKAMHCFG